METREAKRLRDERGIRAAEQMNNDLSVTLATLDAILPDALTPGNRSRIAANRKRLYLPPPDLKHLTTPEPAPSLEDFLPEAPTGLGRLVRAKAYRDEVATATAEHGGAVKKYEDREAARLSQLAEIQENYEAKIAAIRQSLKAKEKIAVSGYFEGVLDERPFPSDFPTGRRVEYIPDQRQLKVVLILPRSDVIPPIESYRYVKNSGTFTEKKRAIADIRSRYSKLLGSVVLRSIYEIFQADPVNLVDHVVLNGIVDTIDTSTGHPIQPVLVSLLADRSTFFGLNLTQLDPNDCLRKKFKARTSRSPAELLPVPPILEFDMNDDRFIEVEAPVDLGLRPNLLDLDWKSFERLIHDLVAAMGYTVKQTRGSNDRGVDIVAVRDDPVFPLKAIFQAKRYKGTVEAAVVREMYGTFLHEGATHGVVVTTSHFGPSAYEWIEGKQIQLWDGTHLLDLLKRHMGVEATIVLPPGGRTVRDDG
ncbi:restriction system protein [Parafrankia irregularis]|uniref:Restriction system protein n=1 Tax=Parafrankia irregularis TaxID=795642 RepID=A0A0S4QWE1_9ACTN|nr:MULTISPECIES: restriction endonuclease [Parafrankia]MBE3203647.1 restriction endonuclease [Parafrankia sp. CH37]CUU59112.1 restriction system protein [Parafrankia irregularis]